MQAVNYITKRTVVCPTCGKDSKNDIDYQLENLAKKAAGFAQLPDNVIKMKFDIGHCEYCGVGMRGEYLLSGEVMIEPKPNDKTHRLTTLVKIPPQTETVYFVIETQAWTRKEGEPVDLDQDYYINEHSCPTNWFGDIRAVVIGADGDPHGLIRHVRSITEADADAIALKVRQKQGYDENGEYDGSSDSTTDFLVVAGMFPEVLIKDGEGDTIDVDLSEVSVITIDNGVKKLNG
jgi:hypothetical protein